MAEVRANVLRPQSLSHQNIRIPGNVASDHQAYWTSCNVLELANLLDDADITAIGRPLFNGKFGSYALTLKVFDCEQERLELAQLTVIPHSKDPFVYRAAWSTVGTRSNSVLIVQFWPYPLHSWTVLRVVSNLLRIGRYNCADVSSFHFTCAEGLYALPSQFGWE